MIINATDKNCNIIFSYDIEKGEMIYSEKDCHIFEDEKEIIIHLNEYETKNDNKIKI